MVKARLVLECELFGLRPPPAEAHLKFLKVRDEWQLVAWSPGAPSDDLQRWLTAQTALGLETNQMDEIEVSTFRVGRPERSLAALLSTGRPVHLEADPSGQLRVDVTTTREDLRGFLAALAEDGERQVTIAGLVPADAVDEDEPVMTDRQREVLLAAYQGGFFDAPQRLSLRELASQLEVSQSTLSVLMRSAEKRLVELYLRDKEASTVLPTPAPSRTAAPVRTPAPAPRASAPVAAAAATSAEPRRVLLVDDEPDILDTMNDLLPLYFGGPVELERAASGPEAIRKLKSGHFDAVVSDQRMPEMQGTELLAWVKKERPQTVRILMTAYSEPGLRERAVNEAAIHLLLRKPFDLAGAARQIRQVIQAHPDR